MKKKRKSKEESDQKYDSFWFREFIGLTSHINQKETALEENKKEEGKLRRYLLLHKWKKKERKRPNA